MKTSERTFEQLVEALRGKLADKSQLPKEINFTICEDEPRGVVLINDYCVEYKPNEKHGEENKRILLILESPHKHEFEITPPKPAQGPTGTNIVNSLPEVVKLINLNNIFNNGKYNLFILNSIQNQVSLGEKPEFWRTILFIATWFTGGENNFKKRLLSLYIDGSVIINCCTIGQEVNNINKKIILNKGKLKVNDILTFFDIKNVENQNINLSFFVEKSIKNTLACCNYVYVDASHPVRWCKYLNSVQIEYKMT